jgi:hypothetical protein
MVYNEKTLACPCACGEASSFAFGRLRAPAPVHKFAGVTCPAIVTSSALIMVLESVILILAAAKAACMFMPLELLLLAT